MTAYGEVIDVSGDGPNNSGDPVTPTRDKAMKAGIVINGLAIMLRPADAPSGLDKYYADCVIGGPGSFVLPVQKIEDFAIAVRRKLVMEISGLTHRRRCRELLAANQLPTVSSARNSGKTCSIAESPSASRRGRLNGDSDMSTSVPRSLSSQDDAQQFFDTLSAVSPVDMIGLWQGEGLATGHPFDGVLENLGWFGKQFHPDLRSDALLFRTGAKRLVAVDPSFIPVRLALRCGRFGRSRIARTCFSYMQKVLRADGPVASLKSMPFRNAHSAAMVYDRQPIIDYFRRIDGHTLLGAMTIEGDGRIYFFVLTRVSPD